MIYKRIVIATGIYPPDIGGPAFFASQFVAELARRKIPFVVASYGPSGISRSWPRGIRHGLYFLKLFFASFGARGIIVLDSLGAGLPALFVSWILRKRIVLRLGGDFLWERYVNAGNAVTLRAFYEQGLCRTFPILFRLVSIVLRHADTVVFTTAFQRDIFVRQYGLLPSRIAVIPNVFVCETDAERSRYRKIPSEDFAGLSSSLVPPLGGHRARSSSSPAVSVPRPSLHKIILWAGRMIPLKNIPLLIRVFQKLHASDSSLRLRLVGDGPERDQIAALIDALKLSDSVMLTPAFSEATLDEEIRCAYCVVLPSLTEISPNFALRALSLGTPVVLTSETGIREQFPELYYVDPWDEHAFFAALRRLLEPRIYEQYRQIIAAFPSQLSWAAVIDNYLQFL